MKGLKEQIAEMYADKKFFPTWENLKEKAVLNDEHHGSFMAKKSVNEAYSFADAILSLPIKGLWVEKKCPDVDISGQGICDICSKCKSTTGIIRRPATLQDYLNLFEIVKPECISCEGRLLPDGSKLVWRDR